MAEIDVSGNRHLLEAGSGGLEVDPTKIIWTPYILE